MAVIDLNVANAAGLRVLAKSKVRTTPKGSIPLASDYSQFLFLPFFFSIFFCANLLCRGFRQYRFP